MIRPILLIMLLGVGVSCAPKATPTSTQGLEGRVLWLAGNQMPSTGSRNSSSGSPVSRTLLIYELTHRDQCTRGDRLYTAISGEMVAKVETDSLGYFVASLPVGKYSIFTQEEQGYFANRFDGEGYVNPVIVTKGKTTSITIKIDYEAFY